jgi:hypothetical protein
MVVLGGMTMSEKITLEDVDSWTEGKIENMTQLHLVPKDRFPNEGLWSYLGAKTVVKNNEPHIYVNQDKLQQDQAVAFTHEVTRAIQYERGLLEKRSGLVNEFERYNNALKVVGKKMNAKPFISIWRSRGKVLDSMEMEA